MSKRINQDPTHFPKEKVREERTFPAINTLWLVLCIVGQIAAILFAVFYRPTPQDIIQEYSVTVDPLADGSLDITYDFVWKPIDTSEDLTWVEIGMANSQYTVYKNSLSANIAEAEEYVDGYYTALHVYFDRPYKAGEIVEFSFKINQKGLLSRDNRGYFHEFVPGWFNATPVEHYTFRWNKAMVDISTPEPYDYHIREGSLDCGSYVLMQYYCDPEYEFDDSMVSPYFPFDGSDAYDELTEDQSGIIGVMVVIIIVLIAPEVYLIDSFVSYNMGRGFLSGYGYRVHLYGRVNPRYTKARDIYAASTASTRGGRSGGGRGCACACACACAGGGRAGCSQKDTYTNTDK